MALQLGGAENPRPGKGKLAGGGCSARLAHRAALVRRGALSWGGSLAAPVAPAHLAGRSPRGRLARLGAPFSGPLTLLAVGLPPGRGPASPGASSDGSRYPRGANGALRAD